jgi:hypothetical protein
MIFLSTQPDEILFRWQLMIQKYNFLKVGIKSNEIVSLTTTDQSRKNNLNIVTDGSPTIYFKDSRCKRHYQPSLRAHLIKKHFLIEPEFYKQPIFYHDSDVVFRELPDFKSMIADDIWYMSDTRSYLDSNYIRSIGGFDLLKSMCDIVGINIEVVLENDQNVGGAQFIMKNTTYSFWDKVEQDGQLLFDLLQDFNNRQAENYQIETGKRKSDYVGIQAWCAEMWAILWNAWLFGHKTFISTELNFCWVDDPIEIWKEKKILHYTGTKGRKITEFAKRNYVNYFPFYDDFDNINRKSCSAVLVNLIESYEQEQIHKNKINLTDVTVVLPIDNRLVNVENLNIIVRYIYKHFDTKILVFDFNHNSSTKNYNNHNKSKFSFYNYDNVTDFFSAIAKTEVVVILNALNTVFSIKDITTTAQSIKNGLAEVVLLFDGPSSSVDVLFKTYFKKILDFRLLSLNKNKFTTCPVNKLKVSFLSNKSFAKLTDNSAIGLFNLVQQIDFNKKLSGLKVRKKSCLAFVFSDDEKNLTPFL